MPTDCIPLGSQRQRQRCDGSQPVAARRAATLEDDRRSSVAIALQPFLAFPTAMASFAALSAGCRPCARPFHVASLRPQARSARLTTSARRVSTARQLCQAQRVLLVVCGFMNSHRCTLLQALSVRCSATATELPASLQTLVQAFQSVQDPMAVRRPPPAATAAAACHPAGSAPACRPPCCRAGPIGLFIAQEGLQHQAGGSAHPHQSR